MASSEGIVEGYLESARFHATILYHVVRHDRRLSPTGWKVVNLIVDAIQSILTRGKTAERILGRFHMNRTNVGTAALILLILPGCVVRADSQRKSIAFSQPCPDKRTWTGRYRNYVYGFSIVIPLRLKGYWNSSPCAPDETYGCVCMGDHGRFIPLSNDAHIEALVGYQMESHWSVIDHERQAISFLRNNKQNVRISVGRSRWFRLGSLRARRFEARYIRNDRPMLTDHIIALHKGVEYELILVTSPGRYGADRRQFEKIIASWRLTNRV